MAERHTLGEVEVEGRLAGLPGGDARPLERGSSLIHQSVKYPLDHQTMLPNGTALCLRRIRGEYMRERILEN